MTTMPRPHPPLIPHDLPSKPAEVRALWGSSQTKSKTGKRSRSSPFSNALTLQGTLGMAQRVSCLPRPPWTRLRSAARGTSMPPPCQPRPKLVSRDYWALLALTQRWTEPQGQDLERLQDTWLLPLSGRERRRHAKGDRTGPKAKLDTTGVSDSPVLLFLPS